MSTEFNTAEDLPVELPDEREAATRRHADPACGSAPSPASEARPQRPTGAVSKSGAVAPQESWRREMQARLQQYRERCERSSVGREAPPPPRVIPFRRPRPARAMEWAIPDRQGQPECIPPGLPQPVSADSAALARPAMAPAADGPAPPMVRAAAAAAAAPPAAPAVRPEPGPEASPAAAAPACPQRRKPILPAESDVAEPVIRPRERRVHPAPPFTHSEKNRIRIELNAHRVEPEEPNLALPQPAAPRFLRFNALMTDASCVLAGSVLFAVTVLARTGLPRQVPDYATLKRLIPAFVGVPGLLFAVYVLISFTFSDGTPGMKQAGLEVRTFSGRRASRRALRRRGWAMVLSLAACGLGLIWAGCDSDALTLHDHISSTYLTVRRRRRPPKARPAPGARTAAPRKPMQPKSMQP